MRNRVVWVSALCVLCAVVITFGIADAQTVPNERAMTPTLVAANPGEYGVFGAGDEYVTFLRVVAYECDVRGRLIPFVTDGLAPILPATAYDTYLGVTHTPSRFTGFTANQYVAAMTVGAPE